MPVNLTVRMRPRRPALTLAVQLLAIVAVATGVIAIERTADDGLAGPVQEIAGP